MNQDEDPSQSGEFYYQNPEESVGVKNSSIDSRGATVSQKSGLGALKNMNNISINTKYNISWENLKEENEINEVVIDMAQQCTVEDCITQAVKSFNARLSERGRNYMLLEDFKLYSLYQAKKNGKPKLDYPSMDYGQLLSSTGITNFSLLGKDDRIYRNPTLSNNSKRSLEFANNPQIVDKKGGKDSLDSSISTASKKTEASSSGKKPRGCPCFPWYKKKPTDKLLNNKN